MKPVLGNCSSCGEQVEFDEHLLGREAECPFCSERFTCESNGAMGGGLSSLKVMAISAVSVFALAGGTFGAMKAMSGKGGEEAALPGADGVATLAQANVAPSTPAPSSNNRFGSSAPPANNNTGMDNGMSMGMDNGMSMGMDNGMSMGMDNGMAMGNDMGMAGGAAGGLTYNKDVLPIMQSRCVSCHGPDKVKGSLRLDSLGAVRSAGVVEPGKATRSPLYTRVNLPAGHDDIMPPRGNPLSSAQQDIIKRWIDSGAR